MGGGPRSGGCPRSLLFWNRCRHLGAHLPREGRRPRGNFRPVYRCRSALHPFRTVGGLVGRPLFYTNSRSRCRHRAGPTYSRFHHRHAVVGGFRGDFRVQHYCRRRVARVAGTDTEPRHTEGPQPCVWNLSGLFICRDGRRSGRRWTFGGHDGLCLAVHHRRRNLRTVGHRSVRVARQSPWSDHSP